MTRNVKEVITYTGVLRGMPLRVVLEPGPGHWQDTPPPVTAKALVTGISSLASTVSFA